MVSGTKQRKGNQFQSLELRDEYPCWEYKFITNASNSSMFNSTFQKQI